MSKTIVGIFDDFSNSQLAANKIKEAGMSVEDVSILSKDSENSSPENRKINDNISDGVTTGTFIGGAAGVLIGIGTVAIPGLGVIAAAGPIVGLLSGALTGGIVGGLIDLGIPEENSKNYQDEIKQGKTLLSIKCPDESIDKVSTILYTCGASNVKSY